MIVTAIANKNMLDDKDMEKIMLIFKGTKSEAITHVKEHDGAMFESAGYIFTEYILEEN